MAVPVNSATSGEGYGVQNGVRFCAHRHARGHRNSPPDCCYPDGLPCSSLAQRYYEQKSTRRNALCFLLERITRLARCAFARTGTHAGTTTVPRTVAILADCLVRVSQYCRTKKARQKALLFLLERITRLARCASARTGTHAGTATVPRTVATLTGCPVRVSQYYRTKKARQKALLSLLERITRLELATSTLARWRSTR